MGRPQSGANQMNIIEAAKAMREGKKVRRPLWSKSAHIYASECGFVLMRYSKADACGDEFLEVDDLLATDWEVVE